MRRVLALTIVGAILALGARASANGRYPAANQVVVSSTDAEFVVLRATFGLLFSHDRGSTWDWVCEGAVGYGGIEDPSIGILDHDAVIAGTFEGLSVSPDGGCGWSIVGGALMDDVFVDVVVRRESPLNALALASSYDTEDDAGASLYASQLFATSDNGVTWSAYGPPIDPTVKAATVEVAVSDPHRLYVSGTRGTGASLTGVLLVSDDDGATWASHDIPIDRALETGVYIGAVDPTNADRVYLRTTSAGATRLFVSDDAGGSFRVAYTTIGPMLGFAIAPDGSKVYLGGPMDGLLVASAVDLAFTQTSSVQIQCLATDATSLFACSNDASGFVLGTSDDDGAHFTAKLHLNTVRGPLACSSTSSQASCLASWPPLAAMLGAEDAGVVDAGATGAGASPAKSKGCACDLAARGSHLNYGGFAIVLGGIVLAMRRRRRS